MIDELTRKNAVNDVKNGMSYLQAAKLHGVEDTAVKRWCRVNGVRSLHASKWKTDDEILDAVMLHKAVTCYALADTLGCTYGGLNMRLRRMMQHGKIQSFRIPHLSHAARNRGLFANYIDMKIYYVSKEDFAKWIRSQLPDEPSVSLRKYITRIFRSLDVNIFKEAKK